MDKRKLIELNTLLDDILGDMSFEELNTNAIELESLFKNNLIKHMNNRVKEMDFNE